MGFLSEIKAALPAVVVGRERGLMAPSQIAQVTGINRFGVLGNMALELAPAENSKLLRLAFKENHYGFIVTSWVAKRFAEAPPLLYDIKEEKSFAKFQSLTDLQKKDSYSLRSKAITQVEEPADPLFKLLKNPNPYQTWAELAFEISVYWTFGNGLLLGNRLESGANAGQVRELYSLPTAYFSGKNAGIAGYQSYVDVNGSLEIPGENVLHLRRINPDAENQNQRLWGMAKFTPARRLLAKSNSALDAEAEAMNNRGGRTILFPKYHEGQEISPNAGVRDATTALRRKLSQAGTNGVAGFDVEIGALEIGMSPVDLNIIKSTEVTKEDYCALQDVNVISVFSSMTGSTFANKKEADKGSIRMGVLPDLNLFGQKLNQFILPAYNQARKYNRYIEHNTDVYPELQEDKKERMEWLEKMGSSINERREANGYSRVEMPEADLPLVPPGFTPITDFSQKPDKEDPKNDGSY